MYGATRATSTLLGVVGAAALLWLGARVLDAEAAGSTSSWDYWAWVGLCALAGLTLAVSQVLGGWTKWGWPRLSRPVLLTALLPSLLVGGWVIASFDPSSAWLGEHVRDWSDDMGVDGLVTDVGGSLLNVSAIALVIGLVAGFSIDTTGPRAAREAVGEPDAVTDEEGVVPAGASVLAAQDDQRASRDGEIDLVSERSPAATPSRDQPRDS